MKIKLSPVRVDSDPLMAIVDGDKITVNGVEYDFSPLKQGDTLPKFDPFASDIERDADGVICLTLNLPHGPNAPFETRFPAAYSEPMNVIGEVHVPPYNNIEEPTND